MKLPLVDRKGQLNARASQSYRTNSPWFWCWCCCRCLPATQPRVHKIIASGQYGIWFFLYFQSVLFLFFVQTMKKPVCPTNWIHYTDHKNVPRTLSMCAYVSVWRYYVFVFCVSKDVKARANRREIVSQKFGYVVRWKLQWGNGNQFHITCTVRKKAPFAFTRTQTQI